MKYGLIIVVLIGILAPVQFSGVLDSSGSSVVISTVSAEGADVQPEGCGFVDIQCWFEKALAHIAFAALWLSSWVLWAAGILFDRAVEHTVIEMASNVSGAGGITAAWSAIRDVVNMVFIFILLYISISLIVNANTSQAKQLLVKVIVVALLLNFSLFITKAIIDVSNIFAIGFYAQSGITASGGGSGPGDAASIEETGGTAGLFMSATKLQSLFDGEIDINDLADRGFKNIIVIGTFGSVFILITAFVFFAASILFILRFVTLVILMVLSPLAFAAWILPKTEKHAKGWFEKLVNESLFAPLFFLLLWVVIIIVRSDSFLTDSGASFSSVGQGNSGAISLILNFIIVMFLLVAALILAKTLGISGAQGTINMGNKLRGWGQRKITGGAMRTTRFAWRAGTAPVRGGARLAGRGIKHGAKVGIGRHVIGRGARKLGQKYDEMEAKVKSSDRYKRMNESAEDETKGNWFTRKANKATLSAAGALNRIAREKVRDTEKSRFGTAYNLRETEQDYEQRERELKVRQKMQALKNARGTDKESEAREELRDEFSRVSKEQLETLSTDELKEHADLLDTRALDMIQRTDRHSDNDYEAIKEARHEPITSAIEKMDIARNAKADSKEMKDLLAQEGLSTRDEVIERYRTQMRDSLENMSDKEFGYLSRKTLRSEEFGRNLKSGQFGRLRKNTDIDKHIRDEIRTNFEKSILGDDPTKEPPTVAHIKDKLGGMGYGNIADLSDNVLMHPRTIEALNSSDFSKLRDKVDKQVNTAFANHVVSNPQHSAHKYATSGQGSDYMLSAVSALDQKNMKYPKQQEKDQRKAMEIVEHIKRGKSPEEAVQFVTGTSPQGRTGRQGRADGRGSNTQGSSGGSGGGGDEEDET